MQLASRIVPGAGLSAWSTQFRRLLPRIFLYLLVTCLSAMFSFPFLWTVSSSLKTAPEMMLYPPTIIPQSIQWGNYFRVFTLFRYPISRWILNTCFLVTITTFGTVISAMLVAYGFARFRFRGRELLFMITLGTMMLPSQVTLIPQFILFHRLGWINTFKPLWIPSLFGGGAFNIFLLRQFFLSLPRELDEAARIDGASYWRIFWTVLVPLCKPVMATVAIISFMASWGDFMGPIIYLNDVEKYTIAVGLRFFQEYPEATYGEPLQHILMAATVLSIAPCLVVFFAGQRYFVRGVVMSGIKG